MRRILIVAGEASGDLHGSGLVRELKKRETDLELFGIGGPKMAAEGMQCLYSTEEMGFIGFTEVLRHLPFVRRVWYHLRWEMVHRRPDLLILIDYPGFNLKLAQQAKKYGIPVLYYISPQVWAWGRNRIKKIAQRVDKIAVLFDFEETLYRQYGIQAQFVGHPLLDVLKPDVDKSTFSQRYGITNQVRVLGLLPGSRYQEVKRILPEMVRTAKMLQRQFPYLQILICKAPTVSASIYRNILSDDEIKLVEENYALMAYADFLIVASGTATLEVAYFQTPFVIVYRVSPPSYWIGKRVIKIDHIGLVNIVAGKQVVPEFVQNNFHAEKLVPVISKFLTSPEHYQRMVTELAQVRYKLGTPGASARVAEMAFQLMDK